MSTRTAAGLPGVFSRRSLFTLLAVLVMAGCAFAEMVDETVDEIDPTLMKCMVKGCSCRKHASDGTIADYICVGVPFTTIPSLEIFPNLTKLVITGGKIEVIRAIDLDPCREKITFLDLADNLISEIEEGALYLPNLHDLILENNRLSSIPGGEFLAEKTNFGVLNLGYNNFSEVPRSVAKFRLETLEALLLNNNPIGNRARFGNLTKITTLDLSYVNMNFTNPFVYLRLTITNLNLNGNHFKMLEQGMLNGFPTTIETLELRHCGIQVIKRETFSTITNLRNLYLEGNNLTLLRRGPFCGLDLIVLDLENCNISDIRKTAFESLTTRFLYLNNNNLGRVNNRDFQGLYGLKELDLTNSSISSLGGTPFQDIKKLEVLLLTNNNLTNEGIGSALRAHPTLRTLVLSGNRLETFPNMPDSTFPMLWEVYITHNNIASLSRANLANMTQLRKLHLMDNPLQGFPEDDDTFADTPKLTLLHFDFTLLTRLPNVTYLPELINLHVSHSRLTYLPSDLCIRSSGLVYLEARGNFLTDVPTLRCRRMAHLDISHNSIHTLHSDLLQDMPLMNTLEISENGIRELDRDFFKGAESMEFLDMGGNELRELPDLSDMPFLVRLNVSHNRLTRLEDDVFAAQSLLDIMYLNSNDLEYISPIAFPNHNDLNILNMSSNPRLREWKLPGNGFQYLARLYLEDMPSLHQVPTILEIPYVKDLYLTYAYHCCSWETYTGILTPNDTQIPIAIDNGDNTTTHGSSIIKPPVDIIFPGVDVAVDCREAEMRLNLQLRKWFPDLIFTTVQQPAACLIFVSLNSSYNVDMETIGQDIENIDIGSFIMDHSRNGFDFTFTYREKVKCTPHQDPLTPCQFLLSNWTLRALCWVIWIFAAFGNGAILFINVVTRNLKKLESSELLIINLTLAGFCKAIYLAFLAIVDVRTFGNSYFQSVVDWQLGAGCKSAGFVAVFASVLSMYILVILTLERVYTISHALQHNERKKRHVVRTLCVIGWILSAVIASLPLFGVNSYTRVSICLPYLTDSILDRAYIGILFTIQLMAFVIVLCSYVYIFLVACRSAPQGNTAQKRKDMVVNSAKIGAVIAVAFLSWSPIAVVGYLALFRVYLIDVVQSKYLIVFVYSFDAFCNPFIYGIFTKRCRSKLKSIFRRSKDRVVSYPPNHHMRLQRASTAFAAEYQMNKLSVGSRDEELTRLRQSRRSSSLVVPMVATSVGTPSPTFCVPAGCNMSRRASLPPGFGSTLNMARGGDPNLPHYSIPFRGLGSFYSSNNSSLPNLQEESDVDLEHDAVFSMSSCAIACPTATGEHQSNPLTSSQESNLRRLSVVREEETEENLVASNSPATTGGDDENVGDLVGNRSPSPAELNSGDENDTLSVSSSEDYSDASDSLSGSHVDVGETDLDHVVTTEPSLTSLGNTEVGGARGTDLDHVMSMNGVRGTVGGGGVVNKEGRVTQISVPVHLQLAACVRTQSPSPYSDNDMGAPEMCNGNHTPGHSPSLEPSMEKSQLHNHIAISPATSASSSPYHSPTNTAAITNSNPTNNELSVNPLCTLASQALSSNSETDL